ncbi:MAG: hypothetical protein ACI9JL_001031 [Paracoccaceae bacterium]|jgi:uncharacterized protein involved in response to NO
MASNQERLDWRRHYAGPEFLKEGFRPLFMAAGAWAALAAPLWVAVWTGAISYDGAFPPQTWHIHEMMFGFVAAAVGGFILTAVPNWTGRLPVRGLPLAGLAVLWLAGRVAVWFSASIGPIATAAIDLLYLTALVLCVANEILAGRNWKNTPVLLGLALLATANGLFHLEAMEVADTGDVAIRLSIGVMALLVALIGGRVVPSFTRNWFKKNDGPEIASPMVVFDRVVLAVSGVALIAWVAMGEDQAVGAGLTIAGLLNLARLARWRGWATMGEGLVVILHVGYLWLAVGLILLGVSMLQDAMTTAAALHMLTLGAMGTMTLAVMTRAILGHTGRDLHAGRGTMAIYAFVTVAMVLRVAYAFAPTVDLIWASAGFWTAAFALFVWIYAPLTYRSR